LAIDVHSHQQLTVPVETEANVGKVASRVSASMIVGLVLRIKVDPVVKTIFGPQ
jgi:hypothetical protein